MLFYGFACLRRTAYLHNSIKKVSPQNIHWLYLFAGKGVFIFIIIIFNQLSQLKFVDEHLMFENV